MCVKNINAISTLYKTVVLNGNGTYTLSENINHFSVSGNETSPHIGNFNIITELCLMGERGEQDAPFKDGVKVRIRLTKLNRDPGKQYSWDIDEFDVDSNGEGIGQACMPFITKKHITSVKSISLRPDDYRGGYVIKVLIKDNPDEDKWKVQSISSLDVD